MSASPSLSSSYPVLITSAVAETVAFYRQHFGFEVSFESDWYVSLRHASATEYELAVLVAGHPTVPAQFRELEFRTLLNLEVDDATQTYGRLVEGAGLPVVQPLRDEAFGQRHFITQDPAGNLVDVIEHIPPSAEFAAAYLADPSSGR
ncbi:MAG: VOC family protein [Nannocystaceae bacterium]|nr:VOC family protein [bacterium]